MLPVTVVPVPTVVPPDVQVVGALGWGPKALKVMVPVALEPEDPARPELIDEAAMVVPAVPAAGPEAVRAGDALATTISDIPEPQVLAAALLFVSPP